MKADIMHTILVVDDEKVIRDGCSRLLSREGYTVLTAVNGQEALEMLATEPVDLILCDLVMPVMGAFEVLEEVKIKHPELPLIIITGHGTVSNAVEAMKNGAYDFITKPFRADHMALVIKRASGEANPGASGPGAARSSGPESVRSRHGKKPHQVHHQLHGGRRSGDQSRARNCSAQSRSDEAARSSSFLRRPHGAVAPVCPDKDLEEGLSTILNTDPRKPA